MPSPGIYEYVISVVIAIVVVIFVATFIVATFAAKTVSSIVHQLSVAICCIPCPPYRNFVADDDYIHIIPNQ